MIFLSLQFYFVPLCVRRGGLVEGKVFPNLKQLQEKLWRINQKHTADLQQPHPRAFVFIQCSSMYNSHSIHTLELVKTSIYIDKFGREELYPENCF